MANAIITDQVTYDMPEQVFVTQQLDVSAEQVRNGDVVKGGRIYEVRRGPKWVTLLDIGGKPLAKLAPGDRISVHRTSETEESEEVRTAARRNQRIVEYIATRKNTFEAALSETNRLYSEHGRVSSNSIEAIIVTQAREEVWGDFVHFVGQFVDLGAGKDHVAAVAAFKAKRTEKLLFSTDHMGRSTSMVVNLMDEALRQASARFINDFDGDSLYY